MEMKTAVVLLISSIVLVNGIPASKRTKRQIFREQLLPYRGGKVPEDAFRADRLALNRLNKEGIAVPDGVLLEHRHEHSHPHAVRHDPEDENSILRVVQQDDNRFVPEEGRYHNEMHLTVASTYLIRKPIGQDQTNIRTPDQQRPLHQYINYKQHGLPDKYQPDPLPQHRQAPAKQKYRVTYQRQQEPVHRSPPQVYHVVPVPFDLPNREVMEERYFSNSYPVPKVPQVPVQPISSFQWQNRLEPTRKIQWTFPDHGGYTLDYSALVSGDTDFSPAALQFYETPEPLSAYNNFFGFFDHGTRFLRKTEEGVVKGATPAKRKTFGERSKPKNKTDGKN